MSEADLPRCRGALTTLHRSYVKVARQAYYGSVLSHREWWGRNFVCSGPIMFSHALQEAQDSAGQQALVVILNRNKLILDSITVHIDSL